MKDCYVLIEPLIISEKEEFFDLTDPSQASNILNLDVDESSDDSDQEIDESMVELKSKTMKDSLLANLRDKII